MTLGSQTQYARHRGVSSQRITELKSKGRLIFNGKKVDFEASDRALESFPQNYRGGEKGGSRSAAAKAQDVAPAGNGNGNGAGGLQNPTPQGMAASVAMKEFYLSKLRQVEYDEKLTTLVDVASVTEEVAAVFATVRNLFLGCRRNWRRGSSTARTPRRRGCSSKVKSSRSCASSARSLTRTRINPPQAPLSWASVEYWPAADFRVLLLAFLRWASRNTGRQRAREA